MCSGWTCVWHGVTGGQRLTSLLPCVRALGIKIWSSGLAASLLTCCSILAALVIFIYLFYMCVQALTEVGGRGDPLEVVMRPHTGARNPVGPSVRAASALTK